MLLPHRSAPDNKIDWIGSQLDRGREERPPAGGVSDLDSRAGYGLIVPWIAPEYLLELWGRHRPSGPLSPLLLGASNELRS